MNIIRKSTSANILTSLVLSGGEITNDNAKLIKLTNVSSVNFYKSITALKNAGYIEEYEKTNKYKLKLYKKRRVQYEKSLWKGAEEYEACIEGQNTNAKKRFHALAELLLLMQSANVAVAPDEAVMPPMDINTAVLPMFVSSREVRKKFETEDLKERMSRYNGMFITVNGVMPVYNLSKSMLCQITLSEENAIKTAEEIRHKYMPYTDKFVVDSYRFSPMANDAKNRVIPKGCLLVTDEYDTLRDYFFMNRTTRRKGDRRKEQARGISYLSNFFDNIYAIPMINTVSAEYINMFTIEEWHRKLTDIVLKSVGNRTADIDRKVIDTDGEIDGVKIICFIDGDIKRLKAAIQERGNKEEKYEVVCYDFQEDLLDTILPKNFSKRVYSMEAVYQAFCSEAENS